MQCILCKIYFWKVFHKYYNLICTLICTKKFILVKSGCYKMERHHGAGYNWRNTPIDGDTVYAHGRWYHYCFHSPFWYFIQMLFTSFELWRYMMFNGLINSTQVQPQRESSSRSSGGSTLRRRTVQDIAAEKMKQWMGQNEEYNMQIHEYYRQWEVQQDAVMAQQHEALQVGTIVNNQLSKNWTLNLYH
jgi:hypothetical protein